jgi:NAD(P)-dependent dehydrogenase (short-subunit alcohol dehydrogenase family)
LSAPRCTVDALRYPESARFGSILEGHSRSSAQRTVSTGARILWPFENSWSMFTSLNTQRGGRCQKASGAGRTAVVLGGTSGIGKEIVKSMAAKGTTVYPLGPNVRKRAEGGQGDRSQHRSGSRSTSPNPRPSPRRWPSIETVDDLVIAAIERDANTIGELRRRPGIRLVTLKLVGYAEAIHALRESLHPHGSIVLFGGLATAAPLPRFDDRVDRERRRRRHRAHSLTTELAPVRINAIHPGIIGDSPFWENKDNSHVIARTPLGRLVTMQEDRPFGRVLYSRTRCQWSEPRRGRRLAAQVGATPAATGDRGEDYELRDQDRQRQGGEPRVLRGSLEGVRRQVLVSSRDRFTPYDVVRVNHLDSGGHVDAALHSFEFSVYVLSGKLASPRSVRHDPARPDHCIVPIGTTYSLRALDGPVPGCRCQAPAELDDGRRQDTFFTGEPLVETDPVVPDMRDPRNRNAVRFDADAMDLHKLAGGRRRTPRRSRPAWRRPSGLQRHRRQDAHRPAAGRAAAHDVHRRLPADRHRAPPRPPLRGGLRLCRGRSARVWSTAS